MTCVGEWAEKDEAHHVENKVQETGSLRNSGEETNTHSKSSSMRKNVERTLIVKSSREGVSYCINYSHHLGLSDKVKGNTTTQGRYNMRIYDKECGFNKNHLFKSDQLRFRGQCQEALTDQTSISSGRKTPAILCSNMVSIMVTLLACLW